MRTLILAVVLVSLLLLAPSAAYSEDEEGARPGGGQGGRGGVRGGRGGMLDRIKRMDADGDGEITRDEFTGPERMFDRLDGDGDGVVSSDELKAMAARVGGRRGGGASGGGTSSGGRGAGGLGLEGLDKNEDQRVSKDEWAAWFAKADKNGDGFVDSAEWEAAASGRRLMDPAPKVGDPAPKVLAKRLGSKQMVDLGALTRTTVLIFGSHT